MKTTRRRDRAGRPAPSGKSPAANNNEALDDELSYDEEQEPEYTEDTVTGYEATAQVEEDGAANVTTNGTAANGKTSTGTGHTTEASTSPRTAVPNLPRRRPRPEPSHTQSTSPAVAVATSTVYAPRGTSGKPSAALGTSTSAPVVTERPSETLPVRIFRLIVTYENLIYMGILVLAIITRFWDIGNRGIHHDESLHSVYSRNLYIGTGYTHDPMMHGPLQFHLIAFMYWLFGATDATARFASAFCGIWVVMAPYFLRRQMGRWPALIASFLLLISPSILYFSRMAREDSIFSAMEMIMIVGLWRFVSTRRPSDFFVFMAGLSLMFTIKETAFLSVAVLGVFFAALFAFQAGYAILGALAGYGVAMGGLFLFLNGKMKTGEIPQLPDIPVTNPDYNTIMGFVGSLLTHPLVVGAIVITLLFVGVLIGLFVAQRRRLQNQIEYEEAPVVRRTPVRRADGTMAVPAGHTLPTRRSRPVVSDVAASENVAETTTNGHTEEAVPNGSVVAADEYLDTDEATEVWDAQRLDPKPGSLLSHYQPGSLPYLLGSLFARPSVILIGVLIASAIFITLYTVFFTDVPRGIASGLFASLGYWMAQHDVQRGGQPWYYYLLLIPLYEPIAVFFGLVATAFFSVRGIRGLRRRRQELAETGEPGLGAFNVDRPIPFAKFSSFLPLFTIWWLAGAFFIYSWAGEKMPWLMVHMVRPAILLSSLFLGALAASIIARRQERQAWADEYYASLTPVPAPAASTVPVRRPAADTGVPTRRRGADTTSAVPQRRRPVEVEPVYSVQEPPWVAWNQPGSKFPAISFITVFILLAMGWGMKMTALTAASDFSSWGVTWIYPALMFILLISYAVWLGPARALRYFAVGIFSVMFLYQFRSAINLTYQHPDVPTEMAVYVQTSPDVTRSVRELNEYSNFVSGGNNIKVVYDDFTSWPYEWYLRDYKNKQFVGGGDPPVGADVPIIFMEYAKLNNKPELRTKLNDYQIQRYAMRWWFPEEWYKNDLIPGQDPKTSPLTSQIGGVLNTAWATVSNPQLQSTLWKYLLFREPPKPLGSEDMIVAIRKDQAQLYHYLQYDPPKTTDVP